MENLIQSTKNCDKQQTFTVKFIATQYENFERCDAGLWTFAFEESLEEIENQFQDGCIIFTEILDKNYLETYTPPGTVEDFDENDKFELCFKYELISDAWIFNEDNELVSVYTLFEDHMGSEYIWLHESYLYKMNGC